MYYIHKQTGKPIKEILDLPDFQIRWLLYNINKDKEERYKIIEAIIDTLKFYINPELYKEEQKEKKDEQHKTEFDTALKQQFKNQGLSEEQLKQIESFFK